MRLRKKGLKITVLSSSNNIIETTLETAVSKGNILHTFYLCLTNCNTTTKLWGLKEKRHDEVIQNISQFLIASM